MEEFPVALRNVSEEEAREFIRRVTGSEAVHAYKAFRLIDGALHPLDSRCKSSTYVPGAVHTVDGPIVACQNGYHACLQWEFLADYVPTRTQVVVHHVYVGEYVEEGRKIAGRYLYVGERLAGRVRETRYREIDRDWCDIGRIIRTVWSIEPDGVGLNQVDYGYVVVKPLAEYEDLYGPVTPARSSPGHAGGTRESPTDQNHEWKFRPAGAR